jgi:hypothetical protein
LLWRPFAVASAFLRGEAEAATYETLREGAFGAPAFVLSDASRPGTDSRLVILLALDPTFNLGSQQESA